MFFDFISLLIKARCVQSSSASVSQATQYIVIYIYFLFVSEVNFTVCICHRKGHYLVLHSSLSHMFTPNKYFFVRKLINLYKKLFFVNMYLK